MAAAAAPLLEFDGARRQVFVVGNEAADVDSLVSAYALASLLDGSEAQAIAVAQITREEFRLRGDALSLFRSAKSDLLPDGSPARLRFWDEVDWDAVHRLDRRSVVLTDHNRATEKVASLFDGRVELIYDHHSHTGAHPDAGGEIVEGLGSACTLIAEQFLTRSGDIPVEMGLLLAGVILLDTRNFSPEENKSTPRDVSAFDRLRAFIPGDLGQDGWYKVLTDARTDVSHLSVKELLMLDLKAAYIEGFDGKVGWAAMMTTLDGALERAGGAAKLLLTMQEYAHVRGFVAVICNFAKDANGFKALTLSPATDDQRALCDAVETRLAGAPANLPKELRENELYTQQGIQEHGFGLELRADLAPLRALRIRAILSRKTLLPRACSAAMGDASAL